MQVACDSAPTLQNGRDANDSSHAIQHDFLNTPLPSGVSCFSSEPSNSPSDDTITPVGPAGPESAPAAPVAYADVVRGPENSSEPVAYVPDPQNELPTRPLSVFFNPRSRVPAQEVFEALQAAGLDNTSVSCIQRQSSGEIVLTFRNSRAKEQFLKNNVVKIRDQPFALQDIDRPLTYLQIFDAPHEMPDATIIQRLAKYCDVLHHRRGYFRDEGWEHVQDGVRHYRVRIKQPIPNFIRFGNILVHFRYEGQPRTCRHCNQTGHYVNSCHSIICYNCEELGHVASECPTEVLCNICKQPDHRARTCPYSWLRQIDHDAPETVTPQDDTSPENDSPETHTETEPSTDDHMDQSEPSESFQGTPEQQSSSDTQQSSPETQQSPSETPQLFENTPEPAEPAPKPQRSRSGSRRQPAQIQPTVIPSRTPTQPVLVSGKPREDHIEDTDTIMNPDSPDNELKRKGNERQRTNKHKKHK